MSNKIELWVKFQFLFNFGPRTHSHEHVVAVSCYNSQSHQILTFTADHLLIRTFLSPHLIIRQTLTVTVNQSYAVLSLRLLRFYNFSCRSCLIIDSRRSTILIFASGFLLSVAVRTSLTAFRIYCSVVKGKKYINHYFFLLN